MKRHKGQAYIWVFILNFAMMGHAFADVLNDISLNAYLTVLAQGQKKDRQEFIKHLKQFKNCQLGPMTGSFGCTSCYAPHATVSSFSSCVTNGIEKTKEEIEFLRAIRMEKLSTSQMERIRAQIKSKVSKEKGVTSPTVTDADVNVFVKALKKRLDGPITVEGKEISINDYYSERVKKDLKYSEESYQKSIGSLKDYAPMVEVACKRAQEKYSVNCNTAEQELQLFEQKRDSFMQKMSDELSFEINAEQLVTDIETYKNCTSEAGKKDFECKYYDKAYYENIFSQLRAKGGCEFIHDTDICPLSDGLDGKAEGVAGVAQASLKMDGKPAQNADKKGQALNALGITGAGVGGGGKDEETKGLGGGTARVKGTSKETRSGIKGSKCVPGENGCGDAVSFQSGVEAAQGGSDEKKKGLQDSCQGENIEFLKATSWLVGYPVNAYNNRSGKNAIADALLCQRDLKKTDIVPWKEKDPCSTLKDCDSPSALGDSVVPSDTKKLVDNINDMDVNLMLSEHILSDLMASYLAALEKVVYPVGTDDVERKQYIAQKLSELSNSCRRDESSGFAQNTTNLQKKISRFNENALKEAEASAGFGHGGQQAIENLISAKQKIDEIDHKIKQFQGDFGSDVIENYASYYPELLPCSQLIKIGAKQIQDAANADSNALCPTADPNELQKRARDFLGVQDKKDLEGLIGKRREVLEKMEEFQMASSLLENSVKRLKVEKAMLQKKIAEAGSRPLEVIVYISATRPLNARVWEDKYVNHIVSTWKRNLELLDRSIASADEKKEELRKKIDDQRDALQKVGSDWKAKRCSGTKAPASCRRDLSTFPSDRLVLEGITIDGESIFPPMAITGGEGDVYLCSIKATALKRLMAERAKLMAEAIELSKNLPTPVGECLDEAPKAGVRKTASCVEKSLFSALGVEGGHNILEDLSGANSGAVYAKLLQQLSPKSIEADLSGISEEMGELCKNPKKYVEERLYQESLEGDGTFSSFMNCGAKFQAQRKDAIWQEYNKKELERCQAINENQHANTRFCDYRERAIQTPYRQFKKSAWTAKNAVFSSLDVGACVAVLSGVGVKIASSTAQSGGGLMSGIVSSSGSGGFKGISEQVIAKSAQALKNNFGIHALGMTAGFGSVELLEYKENEARCRQAKGKQYSKLYKGTGSEANCNPAMLAAFNTVKGLFDGMAFDFFAANGKIAAAESRIDRKTAAVDYARKSKGLEEPMFVYQEVLDPKSGKSRLVKVARSDDLFIEHGTEITKKKKAREDSSPHLEVTKHYDSVTTKVMDRGQLTLALLEEKSHHPQNHKPLASYKLPVHPSPPRKSSMPVQTKVIPDIAVNMQMNKVRDARSYDKLMNKLAEQGKLPFTHAFDPKTGKAWPMGHQNDVYYTHLRSHAPGDAPPAEYRYISKVDGKTLSEELNEIVANAKGQTKKVSFPVFEEELLTATASLTEKGKAQAIDYLRSHFEGPLEITYIGNGADNHVFKVCPVGKKCFAAKVPSLQGTTIKAPSSLITVIQERATARAKDEVYGQAVDAAMKRATYNGKPFVKMLPSPDLSGQSKMIETQKLIEFQMPSKAWYEAQPKISELNEIQDLKRSSDATKQAMGQEKARIIQEKFQAELDRQIVTGLQAPYELLPEARQKKVDYERAFVQQFAREFYDPREIGPSIWSLKRFLMACTRGAAIAAISKICAQARMDYKIPMDMEKRIVALEQAYRDTTPELATYKRVYTDKVYTNELHALNTKVEVGADYLHGKNVAHDPSHYPDRRPDESEEVFNQMLERSVDFFLWDK